MSLILSIFVLVTASFAWLSMNKETNSNGMQLKVEVTPNLIIDGDKNGESAGAGATRLSAVVGPAQSNFAITFNQDAIAIRPSTHSSNYTDHPNGLKYVVNMEDVDISTGVASSAVFSSAVNVESPTTKKYFVDYTVYIASTGSAMTSQDLVATLDPAASIDGTVGTNNDTLKATSIDFYYSSVSESNYKGTLNVAGYNASANDQSAFTSVKLLDNGSIPLNTTSHITIIMRCYFDGALLKSAGQAFINTATVDANNVTINVKFSASDHQ